MADATASSCALVATACAFLLISCILALLLVVFCVTCADILRLIRLPLIIAGVLSFLLLSVLYLLAAALIAGCLVLRRRVLLLLVAAGGGARASALVLRVGGLAVRGQARGALICGRLLRL